MKPISIWIASLLFTAAPESARPEVGLESLLHEMVDRDQRAQLPDPWYVCRQFSSYDRDTKAVGEPGWFANWDRSQFVRREENDGRREWVLMDAAGPGAVVRFWGTWHGPAGGPFSNGTLRVYLDGQPQPAIEGPIADLISGAALVAAPFSESVSPQTPYERRGHNLYLPIPYAQHCKITYQSDRLTDIGGKQGEALYYQINYRTYAAGTRVRSFSRDQLQSLGPLLETVGRQLVESGVKPGGAETRTLPAAELAPGGRQVVEIPGPAAVRRLAVRLAAEDLPQALRSTVLEFEFDGRRTGWCPVGDFFGVGYQPRPHRTWYTRADADGTLSCFWVMPFGKSCRLVLHNLGQQPVRLESGQLDVGSWVWDDRSLHFHTTWREYTRLDTGPDKNQTGEGAFDVNYVEINGRGQYVGDSLTLFNGTAAWWGEGDEKIYIDGEPFPSHIGTGTEDYYGYAWCRPEFFAAPFHAQPCGDGNLAGGFSVNSRYRGLDALPFTSSLKFDMEMWHWRSTRVNFAPATFWFARPGASWNVEPDPAAAALPVARQRRDVVDVRRVPGAVEGESLEILMRTGGTTEIQEVDRFNWSEDRQLWWKDAQPGARLMLRLPADQAGRYRVLANLTKARDYGTIRIAINGRPAAEVLDRYAPQVRADETDLGVFELAAGANRFEVEITGANPQAEPRHMFGLDYLRLERAD